MNKLPKRTPGQPAPVAISYRRFSSPVQGKGDSLRRQGEPTAAWCEQHDVPLDSTLQFDDKGRSAYHGKNVKDEFGELAAILRLIRDGDRIWPGCFLIIENLDRLSRQNLLAGLGIIQQIIEAGVHIVTLIPERIYTLKSASDQMAMFEMCMILMRAHEESKMKAVRCGAAWQQKRLHAASKIISKKCPSWLEPVMNADGTVARFKHIAERVAVVRRVYRLAQDGLGNRSICKVLNSDCIATFGKSKRWTLSTVDKYLKTRQVLGELQSCKMLGDGSDTRVADGDAVLDYFPAIIDEETFDDVQTIRTARRATPRGPRADKIANLFQGMLFDATDGESLVVRLEGSTNKSYRIFNRSSELADGPRLGFAYENFELAILSLVKEIDLSSVAMNTRGLSKEITAAAKKKRQLEAKLEDLTDDAEEADRISPTMKKLISSTSDKHEAACELLTALMRQQSSTAEIALKSAKALAKKLKQSSSDERLILRRKLRAVVPQFITRVDVLILQLNQSDRAALCSVELVNGSRRSLAILCGAGNRSNGDTTLPAELLDLDVLKWSSWPKKWRTQQLSIPSDRDRKMIERRSDGLTYEELGDAFGITKASAHKIIQKWNGAA